MSKMQRDKGKRFEREVVNTLKESGFYVPAIRPPTVPINTSRLRVSLSSSHKRADILHLSNIILL